jgi:FkbM family methyltransferase
MSLYETIAFSLIGTPLQNPAEGLRWVKGLPHRWKHPELRELYRESKRAKTLLERTITPGMNCIDIGCHIGSVLHEIIRLSPGGRHIAVEPLPYKVERLRRKYPRVDVQQVALGEEDSTVEFYYNPRNSGFSGLRGDGQVGSTTLRVECKRLDDIVPPGVRIGFIKMDVEGGEYAVFLGARRVLSESHPVVLFECTRSGLEAFGFRPAQIFSFLVDEQGYRVYLLKDWLSGGSPVDLPRFEGSMTYPFQAFNFVAAPQSSKPL